MDVQLFKEFMKTKNFGYLDHLPTPRNIRKKYPSTVLKTPIINVTKEKEQTTKKKHTQQLNW